ncbi:MAG: 30S ribosomal protein S17e [Candidatus Diapherotrites archaeon]|nr:30S ribosomal protein S17e [Candidatus Diapherotrites archaeon]
MGKQTIALLKTKAEKIMKLYANQVTNNFEENKKFLDSLGVFDYSKKDRNMVAGFITRVKAAEAKRTE